MRIDLKKGGIVRIRVMAVAPKLKGELRWLITPTFETNIQGLARGKDNLPSENLLLSILLMK